MSSNFAATDAAGYELMMGRWSRQLARPFLDFAAVPEGSAVLDVGCGTGSLARELLPRLGQGSIMGVDVAAPYVAYAAAEIRDPRATFEVADATKLRFADRQFDAVVSMLVLNFIPEHRKAIAEMARVTKPGGTIAATVWDFEGGLLMTRLVWDCAAMLDPRAITGRGRVFAAPLIHEGEMAAAFAAHGLVDIEERDILVWMRFSSFADYWAPYPKGQGGIGAYVASLESDMRDRLEAVVRAAYCADRNDGPRAFAGIARSVRARVPG